MTRKELWELTCKEELLRDCIMPELDDDFLDKEFLEDVVKDTIVEMLKDYVVVDDFCNFLTVCECEVIEIYDSILRTWFSGQKLSIDEFFDEYMTKNDLETLYAERIEDQMCYESMAHESYYW